MSDLSSTTTTEPPISITIAAIGDVMVHSSVSRSARIPGTREYDFQPIFAPVAPYLRMADYTVCNLETRLAGPEFGYSSYPRFNSPGELADALADAGVDLAATANNHALDKGWPGIVGTLDRLDEAGVAHVGTYRTLEEKETPFIVDIKGIKVAFVNYTDYLNELTPPREHKLYAVNVLDEDQVAEEAKAARAAGADVVIALLHWGREYSVRPYGTQVKIAEGSEKHDGLLSRGVDVILGSHPHVVEPVVRVPQQSASGTKDTYVVYSLGNFVSGMSDWRTDSGLIVYVHIEKRGEDVSVTGLSYMGVLVQRSGPYPRKVRVLPVLPGVEPDTDTTIGTLDQTRMDRVWDYLTDMLYQPDDHIVPLDPAEIGMTGG